MQVTLGEVIISARDKLLTERPELFMKDKSVYVPMSCILIESSERMEPCSSLQWPLFLPELPCTGADRMIARFLMLCRRPGILVLINNTDWELTGQLQTLVEDGDTVTFISTLHGG